MILRALEKHGGMTVEELVKLTGIPQALIEMEIQRLWNQGKICIDNDGLCYIPPKTSFPTMLFATLLILFCSFVLVGAVKVSL